MKQTIQGVQLSEYATIPLYNIKAVVQTVDISPSTLRAWERRYNVCRPQRSDSGYRLYSDRDIAVIRWLKAQVNDGMAISQAVTWYETLIQDAGDLATTILPSSKEPDQTDVIQGGLDSVAPFFQFHSRVYVILNRLDKSY